jgi:hypothetical protein
MLSSPAFVLPKLEPLSACFAAGAIPASSRLTEAIACLASPTIALILILISAINLPSVDKPPIHAYANRMLDHIINAVLFAPLVLLAVFIGWCVPVLGIAWVILTAYVLVSSLRVSSNLRAS